MIISKANNRKFATHRQRSHKDCQCINCKNHSVLNPHAATAIYDEDEVVIGAAWKHGLLGLFVFYNLKKVLWLLWVKSWHEGHLYSNIITVRTARILKLRNHHVKSTIIKIDIATGFLATNQYLGAIIILWDDLSMGRDHEVWDSRVARDLHIVGKLVVEGILIGDAMLLVVRVEGGWKSEAIEATNNFKMAEDRRFEWGALTGKKVAESDRHHFIILLLRSEHGSLAWSYRIVVPFLCELLVLDLCFNDSILNADLEFCQHRCLFKRERVYALKRICFARIGILELNILCGKRASQLCLDADLWKWHKKHCTLVFCK